MPSFAQSRPEDLRRNARPVDPIFSVDEELYYRVREDECVDSMVFGPAIHIPCSSVNRQKYSKPGDVIAGYAGFKVARFIAGDLPAPVTLNGRLYSFHVEHAPEEDNYSHSEIRVHRDGAYNKNWRYRVEEVQLQTELARKLTVLRDSD